MRPTDPPNVAVVLPLENEFCIFRLGATERNRVILDEHRVQFLENNSLFGRLAHILITSVYRNRQIRRSQIFDKNTLFGAIMVEISH